MSINYSVDTCRDLRARHGACNLHRPERGQRYDPGEKLEYALYPVAAGDASVPRRAVLEVERFVGGGFAGQVYRARLESIEGEGAPGLAPGTSYAVKILVPPSGFARLFRALLYAVGFQGAFQPQVNPDAARAGALWQKFIRRGASHRFDDPEAVNDIHATFVDRSLGSCGEVSAWVDGRTWRLEVDDRMDLLSRWLRHRRVDETKLGSPEFRAKRTFMAEFVGLLNEMGAHEFARQYEWSTWKSQPNCLKRTSADGSPNEGLVAVDFRAGLALLPFLPMSPGDIPLILKGVARGSLVQFDRGNLSTLKRYVSENRQVFAGMEGMLDELERCEQVYRDSVPDITHNHLRLLFSRRLWATLQNSAVTAWHTRGLLDDAHAELFRGRSLNVWAFRLLGLLPVAGPVLQKSWGHTGWRRHYFALFSSPGYLGRAVRAKMAGAAIGWHRAGRLTAEGATRMAGSLPRFLLHLVLSAAPVGFHKFLTDGGYARQRLHDIFIRPVRLYFDGALREEWLRDMVTKGQRKRIISSDDASTILVRIKEPFIQKYLKSLAVHVCTLPITQVISVTLAVLYVFMHPDMPRAEAWAIGAGIIALFQVVPISPGSLTRGLYVLYLVIRERNIKDYNIALTLGFFKYVGYLSFPIQMTYRYPTLARFMAAHWATEAVHAVPVFGEAGALLEHWIFRLFYNWPLTIRRRMRLRSEYRAVLVPRAWHAAPLAGAGALVLCGADWVYALRLGQLPTLRDIAGLVALIPLITGMMVTLGCGGAPLGRRIVTAAVAGGSAGLLYAAGSLALGTALDLDLSHMPISTAWRVFVLSVLSPAFAILTELMLPEPRTGPATAPRE